MPGRKVIHRVAMACPWERISRCTGNTARGRVATPYYEFGVGIQFAAGTAFPAHGSRWNFTLNLGAGLLLPVGDSRSVNLALRYLHISNAGVFAKNAGYDAFHALLGIRW